MYTFLDNKYELIKGVENFNYDDILYLFTEYFIDFDYILGDYSYGKLRLKGFYDSDNKNVSTINDIKLLDSYINDHCQYHKIILLKKIK